MAIHLTIFPPNATPPALLALDYACTDGVAKEVVARLAATGMLQKAGDGKYLACLHDEVLVAMEWAAKADKSLVNAAVKRLLALGAAATPAPGRNNGNGGNGADGGKGGLGVDEITDLAAAVSDVVQKNTLAVTPAPTAAPAPQDLDPADLDLLGPEFEVLRFVLTRTLRAVRPEAYAEYRRIRDGGGASARAEAYRYALGVLARLIERDARRS